MHGFYPFRPLVAAAVCALSLVAAGRALATDDPLISGRALDAEARPLAGARAQLIPLPNNYDIATSVLSDRPLAPIASVRCDRRGGYRFSAPAGLYRVQVTAPGHLAVRYQPLPVADDVELPPVYLRPAEPAVLEFKRRDGRPVPGAWIHVASSSTGPRPAIAREATRDGWRPAKRSGVTDEAGRLTVDRAVGEWLDLTLVPPWSHRPQRILRVEGVRYSLDPGDAPRRTLKITDARGEPLAGALALLGTEGIPVGATDDAGQLTLIGHFSEPERLLLLAADGRTSTTTFVTPRAGVILRQLPDLDVMTGRALSIVERRALPGAVVWSSQDPGRFTRSDAVGSWTLPLPPSASKRWLEARARHHLPRLFVPESRRQWQGQEIAMVLEPAARVRGTVVDREGRPLPGVDLRLDSDNPWPGFNLDRAESRALSDDRGHFALPLWADGLYTLSARSIGFVEIRREIGRAQTAAPLTLVLQVQQAAYGRVLDAQEQPVEGVSVLVTASATATNDAATNDADNPYAGVSDADGRFTLVALPASIIDLAARRSGFAPMTVRGIDVTTPPANAEGDASSGPVDLGTLILEPGARIIGRIVDDAGEPVPGAAVWTVDAVRSAFREQVEALRQREPDGKSADDGGFTVDDLAAERRLDLVAFRAGFLPQAATGVTAGGEEPVEIVLPAAATIAGRVSDRDGRGIAGAALTLAPHLLDEGALAPTALDGDDVQFIRTDGDGHYLFEVVTPGKYRISAFSNAHQPAPDASVEVAARERLAEVDFVLAEGAVLTGVALTEDDEPLRGVRVTVDQAYGVSDSQGRFRVRGIPPGRRTVEGRHARLPRVIRELEIEPGENATELIFAFGVEVVGRVTDPAGNPLGGVWVTLDGGHLYTEYGGTSDSEGDFVLADVAPGDYRLRASKQGFAPFEDAAALRIGEAAPGAVQVVLESGATVAGQLLGLEFEAVETVRVSAEAGRREIAGQVDYEGRYEISDLPPGDWLVRAEVPGTGREAHARVPLAAGAHAEQDLDFETGARLSGTVLWQGSPLPRTVVALRGKGEAIERQAVSNHDGRFELDNLPLGSYRLDASNPRQFLTQNLDVEISGDRELLIEFETAQVSGWVRDEDSGQPLANALVFLQRHLTGESAASGSMNSLGTDSEGAFRFARLARGNYTLRVERDGYTPLRQELEVVDDVGPLELALRAGAGLELQVRYAGGGTPPYVQTAVLNAAGLPVHSEGRAVAASGHVRLSTLAPGTWQLWIAAPGAAPAQIAVEVPSSEPVAVELEPAGRLRVRVASLVRSNDLASLQLVGADGRLWRAVNPDTGRAQDTWPVVAGNAHLNALPGGQWLVRIEDSSGAQWQGEAAITGGHETSLHLD
ncbi:MAG: carboxypeptidase regulatory-like domain-containing protein [Acidobacteriota bacterium]